MFGVCYMSLPEEPTRFRAIVLLALSPGDAPGGDCGAGMGTDQLAISHSLGETIRFVVSGQGQNVKAPKTVGSTRVVVMPVDLEEATARTGNGSIKRNVRKLAHYGKLASMSLPNGKRMMLRVDRSRVECGVFFRTA